MSDQSPDTHWLPLTLAQLDFWEEFRLHPDTPVSTVAHAIESRSMAIAQHLETKQSELTTAIEQSAQALRDAVERGAAGSVSQMVGVSEKIRGKMLQRNIFLNITLY